MSMFLAFNYEQLKTELVQMKPASVLCFACVCAEHLAPVTELWLDPLPSWSVAALNEGWDLLEQKALPAAESYYLKLIEQAMRDVLNTPGRTYSFVKPFVEDGVAAILYMLDYTSTLDITFAASVALRAYSASDQLAGKFIKFRPGDSEQSREEKILASEIVQTELIQQSQALNILRMTQLDHALILQLRLEAQQVGHQFTHRIRRHLDQQVTAWQRAKVDHPIGSSAQGFVMHYTPEGMVINLGNQVQGMVYYQAIPIERKVLHQFLRHKVTAIVSGHDEVNQWILLNSLQMHQISILPYVDSD